MAVTLRVTSDFSKVDRLLKTMPAAARKAAAQALNKVATQTQSEIRIEMTRVFNKPTPYALNATRVSFASANNLYAKVWLKNRAGDPQQEDTNYLYPEVFGTQRGRKAFETRLMRVGWIRSNEFLVPANGLALDSYGNVPTGTIRSILSQAGAAGGLGYSSNATSSTRSKATVAKRGTYFVPEPKSGLPRGIYQRINFQTGTKKIATGLVTKTGKQRTKTVATYGSSAIRMIFKIVVGKPRYQSRLKMHDIGRRVLARDFEAEFDKAFNVEASKG